MDRTERDILQVEMKYLRNFLIWQSVSSSFRRHFHLCPWHSCPIKRAFSLASHLLENRIDCVIVTTLCDTLKEIPSKRSNHDSISLLTFSCLVIELSALAFVYQDLCICLCFCLCLCLFPIFPILSARTAEAGHTGVILVAHLPTTGFSISKLSTLTNSDLKFSSIFPAFAGMD